MNRLIFLCFVCLLGSLSPALAQKKKPKKYEVGYTQTGMASFYAEKFNNKRTASGEKYNMFEMTCAHPSLPFNSIVKITNISNDKWVTLRVNDRGPFTRSRIVDVSKAAALKLEIVRDGTAKVRLEVVRVGGDASMPEESAQKDSGTVAKNEPAKPEAKPEAKPGPAPAPAGKPEDATISVGTDPKSDKAVAVTVDTDAKGKPRTRVSLNPARLFKRKKPAPAPKPEKPLSPLAAKYKPTATYSIWGSVQTPKGFGVQIGSYSDIEKAIERGKEAVALGLKDVFIQSGWDDKEPSFRVICGAVADQEAAKALMPKITEKGFSGIFVRQHFK